MFIFIQKSSTSRSIDIFEIWYTFVDVIDKDINIEYNYSFEWYKSFHFIDTYLIDT